MAIILGYKVLDLTSRGILQAGAANEVVRDIVLLSIALRPADFTHGECVFDELIILGVEWGGRVTSFLKTSGRHGPNAPKQRIRKKEDREIGYSRGGEV